MVCKRICSILDSTDESFVDVINQFDEHEDVLKEAYDFLVHDKFEIDRKHLNQLVRIYYGSLIEVHVEYDVDFNKIRKKSDSPLYHHKMKQHFFCYNFGVSKEVVWLCL